MIDYVSTKVFSVPFPICWYSVGGPLLVSPITLDCISIKFQVFKFLLFYTVYSTISWWQAHYCYCFFFCILPCEKYSPCFTWFISVLLLINLYQNLFPFWLAALMSRWGQTNPALWLTTWVGRMQLSSPLPNFCANYNKSLSATNRADYKYSSILLWNFTVPLLNIVMCLVE